MGTCDATSLRPSPGGPGWALFLDVDGTLIAIAEKPGAVQVEDRLRGVLARLGPALDGAIALVSGRRLEDIDRLFAPLRLPAAGLHGLQRRDADGRLHEAGASSGLALDDLRPPLRDFVVQWPGTMLEDKDRALALHYRQAPEAESAARALVHSLTAVRDDLAVLDGKMVLEVKARDVNKGTAIAAFMAEPPFAGRLPVFLGDDVTDEDGFAMVNALGGRSVRIGDGRPSVAGACLPDVSAVAEWLDVLADQLGREETNEQS